MRESQQFNYFLLQKLKTLRSKKIPDVLSEYRTTDPTIFSKNYNISLNEDGTVFDKDLKMSYHTLADWMKSVKGF